MLAKIKHRANRLYFQVVRKLDALGGRAITTRLGAHFVGWILPGSKPLLCSACFMDTGLRANAERWGIPYAFKCPHCGNATSRKLTRYLLEGLTHEFFVRGSVLRTKFGAAPLLQFNRKRQTDPDITQSIELNTDILLLSKTLQIGIFHYGPRMWMIGDVEPLQQLIDEGTRTTVIKRILDSYSVIEFDPTEYVFRLRKNPARPGSHSEYDSPPVEFRGNGRLDSPDLAVMYCSQDIEQCVHECRVTIEDELYLAKLQPTRRLRLLNLNQVLEEPEVSEFESLDMAVHMLFFASDHSYPISRAIAKAAAESGLDGIIYPSYFNQIRPTAMPFETAYGLSVRRFSSVKSHIERDTFKNLALFGHPISSGLLRVVSTNRLVVRKLDYTISYGPVVDGFDPDSGEDSQFPS